MARVIDEAVVFVNPQLAVKGTVGGAQRRQSELTGAPADASGQFAIRVRVPASRDPHRQCDREGVRGVPQSNPPTREHRGV